MAIRKLCIKGNPVNEGQRQARRSSIRAEVAGHEIKGIISLPEGNERVPFILWDISDDGLGLWVANEIAMGSMVSLLLSKPTPAKIQAEVVWCRPSKGKPGFDCGLRVNENSDKLTEISKAISQTKS